MRRALLLTGVVIGLAACGGGGDDGEEAAPAAAPETITVQMNETNGSGQTGTATLTATGKDSYRIVLDLTPLEFDSQPAHVHEGTCAEYAALTDFDAQVATVKDSLTNVERGKSTTNVGLTPLETRTTGGYSINVHEPTGSFPATACGDIPER